jgi:hypothetical protein
MPGNQAVTVPCGDVQGLLYLNDTSLTQRDVSL